MINSMTMSSGSVGVVVVVVVGVVVVVMPEVLPEIVVMVVSAPAWRCWELERLLVETNSYAE